MGSLLSVLGGSTGLVLGVVGVVAGLVSGLFHSLFGSHGQTSLNNAADNAVIAADTGSFINAPLIAVTGGIALSALGISTNPSIASISEVTVMTSALNQIQVESVDGSMANASKGVALVDQNAGSSLDHVVILSPTASRNEVRADTIDIGDVNEVSSGNKPQDSYKTFFIKDSHGRLVMNPRAQDALKAQAALLRAARTASAKRVAPTVQKAAGISHE